MPRPTIIDRLPKPVREAINQWRTDEGLTIDEIIDRLKEDFGVEVKRATMGLHVKKLEEVGARIRELRAVSAGLAQAVGEGDDQKIGALNRELAHSIMMRLQTSTDDAGNDVMFDPQEAMFIAKALDHLAHAEKLDTDRALAVRRELGKEFKKRIDGIEQDVKAGGDAKPDAMTILKRIREEAYGVFEEPKK